MSDVDVRRFKAAFLKAMSESDSSDAPSAGISIVPLQQARLAWSTARGAVADELGRLDAELRKAFPDAGKLFDRLNDVLQVYDERLIEQLDAALNASGSDRADHHGAAVETLAAYRSKLDADPVLRHIDTSASAPN